jgi:peptide deformylase
MHRDIITDESKLRGKCEAVDTFGIGVQLLCKDMLETLKAHKTAVGLAAPQIGHNMRIIVIKPEIRKGFRPKPPYAMCNPIVEPFYMEDMITTNEGCLSLPGAHGMVRRYANLKVYWQDPKGNHTSGTFHGMDAVKIQHEVDHLNGVLFTDKLEVNDGTN